MTVRTKSASDYLKALDKSLQQGWLKSFRGGAHTIFEQLALLHPEHLEELGLPSHWTVQSIQQSIQGVRSFASPVLNSACDAHLIWGYECELSGDIQQDHLFPYSLGGPTVARNRVFLCKYHNMVKSSDIHCYPWESVDKWAKPWLAGQILRLHTEFFGVYGDP